jgi:hypothetical protein
MIGVEAVNGSEGMEVLMREDFGSLIASHCYIGE